MTMVRRRLLLLLLLSPMMLPSCSSAPSWTPECRLDYTGLALLSCQETAPQAPTRSCCDALLYAVDIFPPESVDQGICCLCMYMIAAKPRFDLRTAYVSCRGKDTAAVLAWMASSPALIIYSCSGIPVYIPHHIQYILLRSTY